MLGRNNRPMFEALDDLDAFVRVVKAQERARREGEAEKAKRARIIAADPFGAEAQKLLEEEIREKNVEESRRRAIEHMPEAFGSVNMLYISIEVNGRPTKAFVDSGAQMTIMSSACAAQCGIERLIDTQFAGLAVGVGTQKIVGRVHMAEITLAGTRMAVSFSVIKDQPMAIILGLDMLKRHQCIIDLKENLLRIGTTGRSTPFLGEAEIPKSERLEAAAAGDAGVAEAGDAGGGAAPAVPFSDEQVAGLLGLGDFTREQAVEALTVSGGDVERAAAYLFAPR